MDLFVNLFDLNRLNRLFCFFIQHQHHITAGTFEPQRLLGGQWIVHRGLVVALGNEARDECHA